MTSYSSGIYPTWLIFFFIPLAFFSFQRPASLIVAIDLGDKQPSKSLCNACCQKSPSCMMDYVKLPSSFIHKWANFVTVACWCLYQMAGCKVDINWDKCLGLTSQGINLCHISTQIVIIFMVFSKTCLFQILNRLLFICLQRQVETFPSHTS